MKFLNHYNCLLNTVLLAASGFFAHATYAQNGEASLQIIRTNEAAKVIPIAISGFSGEADRVIRFDLEVLGCEVVSADRADYIVSGSNDGNLKGQLATRGKITMLSKAYGGASQRQQAHAFADDIAPLIRGVKGIAQTKIVFKVEVGKAKEICVADYDGFNAQQVTRDNNNACAPAWLPGHRVLLYNSYKDGFLGIYSHDLGSGVRRAIAKYGGSNMSPSASRDGRVAMILGKGGSPNLYVANADGSGLRQLTKTREADASPCFSPDGSQICFVSRRDGGKGLFVISSSGGEMRRLKTAGVINATEPDWSPDGKWIIFTTQTGGNSFEVCLVPSSGGEVTRLVSGEDPSWAPNSRTVVFARRGRDGNKVLSLLDVPTKRVKDTARVTGSTAQPAWAR